MESNILIQQFPWLTEIAKRLEIPIASVHTIEVAKATTHLMAEVGVSESWGGNQGSYYDYLFHFAISMNDGGSCIVQLEHSVREDDPKGWDHKDAKPVGRQLYDTKLEPDFILACRQDDAGRHGGDGIVRAWTIYPCKGGEAVEYWLSEIDRAAAALKEQFLAALT